MAAEKERGEFIMQKAYKLISKAVKAAAKFGAGASSAVFGYQPKTPKCLQADGKNSK